MNTIISLEEVLNADEWKKPIGKVEKKAGKRIGYNYIIVKSLKESKKNDVIKCLYIKSITDFGFCVIKEGTEGDTKDKFGRDIKDRLLWQKKLHKELEGKISIPKLLGAFEENGNYYLVLECIKGKPLSKVIKEHSLEIRGNFVKETKTGITFVNYLIQIVKILQTLHEHNIVHRDATANNFIIQKNGKVSVIDLELSYSTSDSFPMPPFQLGTHGYMSPEQLKTETPTAKEDVFAVGAIIFQVWTGISPFKIVGDSLEELKFKIPFFVKDNEIANQIIKCFDTTPANRPNLSDLVYKLEGYKKKTKHNSNLIGPNQTFDYDPKLLIQRSINTLCSPLMSDKEKGWFSENLNTEPNPDKSKINKTWYTSFSRGAMGVVYFLTQAHHVGFDTSAAVENCNHAFNLIESKYLARLNNISPSLHFGSSGIAAVLAEGLKHGFILNNRLYHDWITKLTLVENNEINFSHGISGHAFAYWAYNDINSSKIRLDLLSKYLQLVIENQQRDGSWINSSNKRNDKGKIHTFASGVAGIVYFLLEYYQREKDFDALKSAEKGLRWLINSACNKNGTIHWPANKKYSSNMGWYEGDSGIAFVFIKAYEYIKDPIYKETAIKALRFYPEFVVDNNLSQHGGLSGLGEVYIEAYKILGEKEWMDRADWILQVIIHLKKESDLFGPYWLTQYERQPTPDFMTGNSGVLHFMLRHIFPNIIKFPLSV